VALLASVSLSLAALIHHHPGLALTNAPLIGALVGFLCYNFNPASVFLGDSGSLLVGFLLGCAGLMWNRHASTPLSMAAPLVAMAVPVAEVTISIFRRFIRNRPIFGPDRNHIHHRLLLRGLSQRGTALALYSVSALAALFAVLMTLLRPQLATAALLLFCGIAFLCFRWLRYPEFFVLGRFLFAGEFWRSLRQQLYIKELSDWLASANSVEECWLALRNTCQQADFTFVELRVADEWFAEELRSPAYGGESRFEIPLSSSASVVFGGDAVNLQSGMLIGPCVEALRSKFAGKEAAWKVASISREAERLIAHNAATGG
jgi:UDP-GlcNAc:undecaprenyl-phosphate GlcNAc-1-phosphate transferase